jgi:ATP-dependent DNA ligase
MRRFHRRCPPFHTAWRARAGPPEWIRPQLTQLVQAAPKGQEWLHEIKFDGYRMNARLGY